MTFSGHIRSGQIVLEGNPNLPEGADVRVEVVATPAKPIWEQFDEILATAKPDDLANLPSDGAANHDLYISGKRRGA